MLHSGAAKTPAYVAQRLNRQTLENAEERRAKRFFADARLPQGERAELEDYRHSGYSRGHIAPAGDMRTHSNGAEFQPRQRGPAERTAQRWSLEPD